MKLLFSIIILCVLTLFVDAQVKLPPLIKPEVAREQVMFNKQVWRRMNLTQKQNLPFYATKTEISTLLIKAVNDGLLTPYENDSCLTVMDDKTFLENISVESKVEEDDDFGDDFGDDSDENDQANSSGGQTRRDPIPSDLFSILYIKENLIFDRNRSRMYYYIRTLSLALPSNVGSLYNPAGFERKVVHFRYDEVVKIFRERYFDKALYRNPKNDASSMNMSDAFELRLFNAPIVKMSNPQDLDIRQIHADEMAKDPLSVILLQQKYESDLVDYESNLWEN